MKIRTIYSNLPNVVKWRVEYQVRSCEKGFDAQLDALVVHLDPPSRISPGMQLPMILK